MTSFARALLVILVVAAGVRFGYVAFGKQGPCPNAIVGEVPGECAVGDQIFYSAAANRLAAGDGFVEPFDTSDDPAPAADHPPLTVLVLAPISWLAQRSPTDLVHDPTHLLHHRYTMALLGTVLVATIAWLGRRVGGDAVGLVAAGIAAVSPNLWVNDGLVMSETVAGLAVVGALHGALAFSERPTLVRAVVLGAACGIAALARAELLSFVPLLAVPLALASGTRRIRLAATVLLASGLVVAPWVLFNLDRFAEPTTLSTNDGIALAGSNCPLVYQGRLIGLTSISGPGACIESPHPTGDQSQVAKLYRQRAFAYARAHLGRLPFVLAARVGRTWSVYRPTDMIAFNEGEGREAWVTRGGLVAYYPTLIAALAGSAVLWRARKRRELWVLVVPVLSVTLGAALSYGQTRFRATAEPSLALLAAVAVSTLVDRTRAMRSDRRYGPP
jgi:4-amino-4-deoxy-L-arabinose transferase-like glycosyltransferase